MVPEELRARARRGDVAAFAELIAPDAGRVFALVRRCTLSEEAGFDVLGTSALELFARRGQWSGELGREWLLRAARRVFSRAAKEGGALPGPDASPLAGGPWPVDPEVLGPALEAALRELPAVARAAVVLCDAGGLREGELATASGLTAGEVRRLVHAGRCALLRALDERIRTGARPGATGTALA